MRLMVELLTKSEFSEFGFVNPLKTGTFQTGKNQKQGFVNSSMVRRISWFLFFIPVECFFAQIAVFRELVKKWLLAAVYLRQFPIISIF